MPKVPKSSGQGTGRKAYQTGYRMGNRGTAAAAGGVPGIKGDTADTRSSYSKEIKPGKVDLKMNVSYGNTIEPGDLKDVQTQPPSINAGRPLKERLKFVGDAGPKKMKGFKL